MGLEREDIWLFALLFYGHYVGDSKEYMFLKGRILIEVAMRKVATIACLGECAWLSMKLKMWSGYVVVNGADIFNAVKKDSFGLTIEGLRIASASQSFVNVITPFFIVDSLDFTVET